MNDLTVFELLEQTGLPASVVLKGIEDIIKREGIEDQLPESTVLILSQLRALAFTEQLAWHKPGPYLH